MDEKGEPKYDIKINPIYADAYRKATRAISKAKEEGNLSAAITAFLLAGSGIDRIKKQKTDED
jgi:hypothetical protein